jgi:hypothetical protein
MRTQRVQKEETVVLMHLFIFVLFDCKTSVQLTSVYLTFVPLPQLPLQHTETYPSLVKPFQNNPYIVMVSIQYCQKQNYLSSS